MKAIVAVDRNWGIGRNGGLLTHLPEDMKFFRETTRGKVVVMGRKTLLSFPGGKPLKGRVNLVLTANRDFNQEGVLVCRGLEEVLDKLGRYETEDCFVIGGQSVYEQLLAYCDTAYVTYMREDFQPDTFFANLDDRPEWELTEISENKVFETLHFEFRTYRKKV